MNRSQRLAQLRSEMEGQRRALDQRLRSAEQRAAEAEARADELRLYRDEYANGFTARAAAGFAGAGLRDYQAFLARLDEAVRQQDQLVLRAAAELEFERQRWRDAAVQVKAVEAVGARWDAEEQRADQRREQRNTDEHAMQSMHARRNE
jgi:flagellar protein FliJ